MNRRGFLHTGAAASAFFGGFIKVAEARLVHRGGGSGAVPLVGPALGWTGTALSGNGGSPPTNPTRTTAKPAAKFYGSSNQVVVAADGNFYVGVRAQAWGGIASVRIFGDCASTTITTETYLTQVDPSGASSKLLGHWIQINTAAFLAVSTTGVVRLFAEIVANDTRLQHQVIGFSRVDDGIATTNNDWVMNLLPRTGYDFDVTVPGNYATLALAIQAARDANAGAGAYQPRITVANGTICEAANTAAGYGGSTNGVGMMVIRSPAGGTATIRHASAFDPNTPTSWYWRPGWVPGILFQNMTFDLQNWAFMTAQNNCAWDACSWTNSRVTIATDYLYYWNKGLKPGFGVSDDAGNHVYGWNRNSSFIYMGNQTGYNYSAINCGVQYGTASTMDSTDFLVNNYTTNCDARVYAATATPALTINYTGAGAGTYTFDGTTMTLSANGATVATYTFTDHPGAETGNVIFSFATLQSKVAALANWTATLVSNNWGAQFAFGATNLDVKTSAFTITTIEAIHTEWYHANDAVGVTRYNILHAGNVIRRSYWTTATWNIGRTSDVMIFLNLSEQVAIGSSFTPGYASAVSNFCMFFNKLEDGLDKYATGGDIYCNYYGNTLAGCGTFPASVWGAYPAFTYNLIIPGNQGMPGGANDSNNVSLVNSAGFNATWTNKTAGDDRAAGLALTNLVPALSWLPRDRYGNLYTTNDQAGSLALSAAGAPVYPY